MMSPEDAKRYLDFLERWKQRRIDRCRAGRSGKGRCLAGIPESWTEIDIKNAGEYVANIPENVNIPDGAWIFGEYNSVRVGIIKNNGEIGTIILDNSRQP